MTKVEGQLPRASKRPRKVTETGGRRLGGSKSHSPAVGERGQVGKNRRSKVYQAGAAPEIVQMFESQQLYFVGCKNDILPCVDDQLTEVPALQWGWRSRAGGGTKAITTCLYKLNLALKIKRQIETPTWRIKSTNPCYSMKGTEDIADQVLLKRHEKMEKEE